MEHGNIRQYLRKLQDEGAFQYQDAVSKIHKWVCLQLSIIPASAVANSNREKILEIIAGLSYLHRQGIVHGDLRGVSTVLLSRP